MLVFGGVLKLGIGQSFWVDVFIQCTKGIRVSGVFCQYFQPYPFPTNPETSGWNHHHWLIEAKKKHDIDKLDHHLVFGSNMGPKNTLLRFKIPTKFLVGRHVKLRLGGTVSDPSRYQNIRKYLKPPPTLRFISSIVLENTSCLASPYWQPAGATADVRWQEHVGWVFWSFFRTNYKVLTDSKIYVWNKNIKQNNHNRYQIWKTMMLYL